jgi:hypothetical protein
MAHSIGRPWDSFRWCDPGHVSAESALGPASEGHREVDCHHSLRWLLRCLFRHPSAQILHCTSEADVPDTGGDSEHYPPYLSFDVLTTIGLHDSIIARWQKRANCRQEEGFGAPVLVLYCFRVQGHHWVCARDCTLHS